MGLIFALRILCDTCLYLVFAGLLGPSFGLSFLPMAPLFILALCAYLIFLPKIRETVWRFLPLLLLLSFGFFIKTPADFVILLLPAGYLAFTVFKKLYYVHYLDFRGRFSTALKVLIIPLVLGLLFSKESLIKMSLPFMLIYLFAGVFTSQLMRQSEEILSQRRFRLVNAATLAGLGGLGFILGSETALNAIKTFLFWLYSITLGPIFMGVGYAIGLATNAVVSLINKVLEERGMQHLSDMTLFGNEPTDPTNLQEGTHTDLYAKILVAIAVIALIIFAVIFFIKMMGRLRSDNSRTGAIEIRESYSGGTGPKKRRSLIRTPREKVRAVFRQFIDLCFERGVDVTPSTTSLTMTTMASAGIWCPFDDAFFIRDIYIKARYSDAEITKEDVANMRRGFANIKEYAKGETQKNETDGRIS